MPHVLAQDLRLAVFQMAFSGGLSERYNEDTSVDQYLNDCREKRLEYEKKYKEKKHKSLWEDGDYETQFDIPEEWRWAYVGDIFRHNAGKALNAKNTTGTKRKYLTTSNVYKDHFELDILREMYYTDDEVEKCSVQKGDLLVLEGGDCGRTALWDLDESYCIQNHLHRLRLFGEGNIKYFFYLLSFYKDAGYTKGKGIAIQGLSANALHNIVIPIPPIEEQAHIVAKVDELMAKIDEYEKIEKELVELHENFPEDMKDAILQAAMQGKLTEQLESDEPVINLKQRLVLDPKIKVPENCPFDIPDSWEWIPIGSLGNSLGTDSFSDGPFGSNLKKEHQTSRPEVRIIQLSNIGENGWRDENVKYTSYQHLDNVIPRCEIKPGDFAIAKMMPAGRTIEVPDLGTRITLGSDAMKFVPNKNLNKKYLLYAMHSAAFLDQVYSEAHGITRIRTTLNGVKNYLLPIPPIEEQQRIVDKLDQLLPLCESLEAMI